ncbi:CBS domain-containing protein [Clostridium fermenticellae]|uniref:CBS domain-containing protein n=1 Tax=Clostridium fermenticellae TaxID=2068654 RepID=A0A386H2I2_9CLOT|nr:CBS domain-containing protein [Clostridium fermenticellae]AYD39921.1 CBS domain-containing protein [Clostridium fermenticellae]
MNIAFFLTPKKDVVHACISGTMRQAIEKMERSGYTAIPIIDDKGKYEGTLTEGDLLWKIKDTQEFNFKDTSKIIIRDIIKKVRNKPVHIDEDIENLISLAVNQNFVPVVDDNDIFIGIIKRSEIINYCYKLLVKNSMI